MEEHSPRRQRGRKRGPRDGAVAARGGDGVNENEEEILDKIEEGHRRGEHYTRMAGCSLCTEQFAGGGV
jgi:hypothetical protein